MISNKIIKCIKILKTIFISLYLKMMNYIQRIGDGDDSMIEKQFTVEDIEDMIYQLGVLIADESHGLLITTLKKFFWRI